MRKQKFRNWTLYMSENRLSVSNLTMPSWKWTQVSAIGWCCLETDAYVLNQMLPTENRRNCIGSDGTFLKRTHVSKLVWYHPIKDANVRNRTVVSKIKCWSPKTDGIDWKQKRWCRETESSVRNGRYRLKTNAGVQNQRTHVWFLTLESYT